MKLTEQQFLDGLNADQMAYFNARLVEIRTEFQSAYTASVASVSAAKDQLLIDKTAELEAEKAAHAVAANSVATMQAEIDRLAALVPAPIPDEFANADWAQFRGRILQDPAVQRVALGNPTAWPLMVLYLAQLSTTPSRGLDIAQLWTILEQQTPITPEEVAQINLIATECGVPLQMNADGSIGV